ncbi:MAG: hypothetical protein ACI9XB_003922 [Gammaproteobacteria bacterium]|jgi:hypothetical protein
MSVSYHLVPIEKETESFINVNSFEFKVNNDLPMGQLDIEPLESLEIYN